MKTKVIIEVGCNHNGEMDLARKMVISAKSLGAWSVKFQKRDIDSIPENVKIKLRNLSDSFGENYYEHRKALEFSFDQIRDLKKLVEGLGMVFSCSAFDGESFEFLKDIKTEHIKLPSQLFTDNSFFSNRGSRNYKIIVSTGMHEEEEILLSPWVDNADIILHCISVYPCLTSDMNLQTLKTLRGISTAEIGYSSHDLHGYGIPFAIMAGAKYIERHFTLDNDMKGSDHKTVSSDPLEMAYIMDRIKDVEKIIGGERVLSEKERKIKLIYRGF